MKALILTLMVLFTVSCAHKLNPTYGQSPNPDSGHHREAAIFAGGR